MTQQDPSTTDDFVCVATRAMPIEAHLLRGVLESAGLTAHVADENMVQAYSLISGAIGGVRILVPASEEAAARQTIADFEAGAFDLDRDTGSLPGA